MVMELLSNLLSVFLYIIPIFYFLPFKLRYSQKAILFLLIFFNILLIKYLLGNIGAVLLLLTICAYISLIHTERLLSICIIVTSYLFCVVLDNLLSVTLQLFGISVDWIEQNHVIYLTVFVILINVLCPPIAYALKRFLKKVKLNFPPKLMIMILTNLFSCLMIFLFNIVIGEYIRYTTKILVFNCILFSCYFIFSTYLIVNMIQAYIDKAQLELREDSYQKLQLYTTQIEQMYSSLRSFKHDYFNVMLSMSGYIDTEDISGLKEYFYQEIIPRNQKLSEGTGKFNSFIHIKNPTLKGLLSSKLNYANELGIKIELEVSEDISDIHMDITDLSRILGVFLDNAIEGSLETEMPLLQFAIIKETTATAFIISNTFIDKHIPYSSLRKMNTSTKGANRGFGLYSAHKILANYDNAFLDTEMSEDRFTQRLKITMTGRKDIRND